MKLESQRSRTSEEHLPEVLETREEIAGPKGSKKQCDGAILWGVRKSTV